MKGNIYMTIDKQWLEENKAKAAKAYRETFTGEDNPDAGLLFNLETDGVEVEGTEVSWTLKGSKETDGNPWVSVTYSLDNDDLIRLAEMLIKRLNKAKSLMETVMD